MLFFQPPALKFYFIANRLERKKIARALFFFYLAESARYNCPRFILLHFYHLGSPLDQIFLKQKC